MSFDDYIKRAHQDRVDHFVNFCVTEGREPDIEDAMIIFGFTEKDAQPIVNDAQVQFDIMMGRWIG